MSHGQLPLSSRVSAELRAAGTTAPAVDAYGRLGQRLATWPFDAARAWRAGAIRAGLLKASMLADREFERALGAWERQALGPWARRV